MWQAFLDWIKINQAGDVASVAGVLITIVGFVATLIQVARSKSAASRAEAAAKRARESIRAFETIVDFSSLVASLEEIKRLQRQNAWPLLPDRYSAARKLLISVRESGTSLTDIQKTNIQRAIVTFKELETKIDKERETPERLNVARINAVVSQEVDNLIVILTELKSNSDRREMS